METVKIRIISPPQMWIPHSEIGGLSQFRAEPEEFGHRCGSRANRARFNRAHASIMAADERSENVVTSLRSRVPPSMPFHLSSPYLLPIALLICSNVFMTFAWYGHLKFKEVPLWGVIAVSWGIAFIEYCFAVPANRYGNAVYSAAQLKTMQEVITLLVFAGFSLVYLKEPIGWNHLVGFALISAGAFFIFQKW
jgi:uncharacterized protein